MMKLRESIRIRISEFESDMRQTTGSDARYRTRSACTDDILDLVREALLSDEAVASGEQKWHEIQDDGVNYEGDDERFRASITAVLDAVTTN